MIIFRTFAWQQICPFAPKAACSYSEQLIFLSTKLTLLKHRKLSVHRSCGIRMQRCYNNFDCLRRCWRCSGEEGVGDNLGCDFGGCCGGVMLKAAVLIILLV